MNRTLTARRRLSFVLALAFTLIIALLAVGCADTAEGTTAPLGETGGTTGTTQFTETSVTTSVGPDAGETGQSESTLPGGETTIGTTGTY